MDPRYLKELEHNKKIFDNAEKFWGRLGEAGVKRLGRRAQMIIARGEIGFGKKVLEIGCGTGTLTTFLAATGAQITATDLFQDFLNKASAHVQGSNIQFIVSDAETLNNFENAKFDVVCGLSVLHHLNIKPALKSIYRVLNGGGVFLFSEPNMLNPQIALQKNIPWLKRKLGDSPEETAFFKWQMRGLLKEVGFRDISVEPFDFLHPFIPSSLVNPMEKLGNVLEHIPLVREIGGSLFIFARK